mgnify:CR=1 FL=1
MRTAATQRTRRELASLSVDETCALFGAIGLSTFAATCERDEIDGYVLASSAIFTPSMVEEVWPEAKAWQRAALLSKVADLRDVGVRVDLFARTSPSREAAAAPLPQTPRQRTLRSSPPLSPPTMRPAPPLRGGGGRSNRVGNRARARARAERDVQQRPRSICERALRRRACDLRSSRDRLRPGAPRRAAQHADPGRARGRRAGHSRAALQ